MKVAQVFVAMWLVGASMAQCPKPPASDEPQFENVDMRDWNAVGCGNWDVQPNGYDVVQRSNMGCPNFLTTKTEKVNVIMGGTVNVKSASGDDMLGFVLGGKSPSLETPLSYDLTLVDWKKYGDCASESDSIFPLPSTAGATPAALACGPTFANMTDYQAVTVSPDVNNRMPEGFMLTKYQAKCKCNPAYTGMWSSTRSADQFASASACEVGATLDCGVCDSNNALGRMGTAPADCDSSGSQTAGAIMDLFWDHKVQALNSGAVVAQNLGPNKGWRSFTEYTYRILYTEKRIKVVIDGGAFNWETIFDEPVTNQPGSIGFYSLAQDQVQFSNVQTVDIDLDAVNPVAKSDIYALQSNAVGSVLKTPAASGLLTNDYDPSLSKLTIVVNGSPVTAQTEFPTKLGGKILLNADGSFDYIAPKGAAGIDSLTYSVQNAAGTVSMPVEAQFTFPGKDVARIVFVPKSPLSKPLRNGVVLGNVRAFDSTNNEICNPVITMTDTSSGAFRLQGDQVFLADENMIAPQAATVTYTGAFKASTPGGKPLGPTKASIVSVKPPGSECEPDGAKPAGCGNFTEITQFMTTHYIPAPCHVSWPAIKDQDHSKIFLGFPDGDAFLHPSPGETMTDANGSKHTWYEVTRSGNDNLAQGCYIMFFTATVCSDIATTTTAQFIHDDEFWLYMDGARVHLQEGWATKWKDFPPKINLKAGCNHLVFKLHNGGGPGRFGFQIKGQDCAAKVTISPFDNSGADPVCAQDCEFGDWTEWTKCSNDCGGGEQFRTRKAIKDAKYGGLECPASRSQKEHRECNTQACPPGCSGGPPEGCGPNGRCKGVDRCLCNHGWADVNAPPTTPGYAPCSKQECACTSWGDPHLIPFCGVNRFDWMPLGCYRTAAYYDWEIHESHFKCNPNAPQVSCSQALALVAPNGGPTFEINIVPQPNNAERPDGLLKINGGSANGGKDIDPSMAPMVYWWIDQVTGQNMSINIGIVNGEANQPKTWAMWPDNGQFHTRFHYSWWSEIPTYMLKVDTTTNAGKAAIWNEGVVDYEYDSLRTGTEIKRISVHDPAVAKVQGAQYSPHPACSAACSAEPTCTFWSLDRTTSSNQCRGTNSTCILFSASTVKKVSTCDTSGARDIHLTVTGAAPKPTLCGGGPTENLDAAGTNQCGVSQLNRGPLGPPNNGVTKVPRGFENIGTKANGTASSGGMTSEQLSKYMTDNGVTEGNAQLLLKNGVTSNQLGQLTNQILTDYGVTDVNQQNLILGNSLLLRQMQTQMNVAQTASWLTGQGASKSATDLLVQNNVNGQKLFTMTLQQLLDMGLSVDDARTVYGLSRYTMVDGSKLSREAVYGLMLARGVSKANAQLMYDANVDGNMLQWLTVDQLNKFGITNVADQTLILRNAGTINQAVELGSILAPPSNIAVPTGNQVQNFLIANNVDQDSRTRLLTLTGDQLATYTTQQYQQMGLSQQNALYVSGLGKIASGQSSTLSSGELATWLMNNQGVSLNSANSLLTNGITASTLRTIGQADLIAMGITDETEQLKILSAKKTLFGELNTQSAAEVYGLLLSAGVSQDSATKLLNGGIDGNALRVITIEQLIELGVTDAIEQQKIIGSAAYVARGVERMSAYELGGWLMTRGVNSADALAWTTAGIAGGAVARGLTAADLASAGISVAGSDRILGLLVGENPAGQTPQLGCTAKQLFTAEQCCADLPTPTDCPSVMTDSCNNWVPGMPMQCDNSVWFTTQNNQAGDMNGGINAGNGTTVLGTNLASIQNIELTQPVAQQLLNDQIAGNTAARQIILNGKVYDVVWEGDAWKFTNTMNTLDEWKVNVFTSTDPTTGAKTLNYEAYFGDETAVLDVYGNPVLSADGRPVHSDDPNGDGSSPNGAVPSSPSDNDAPVEPEKICPCCPDSLLLGDAACQGEVALECPTGQPEPVGFTVEDVAWCTIKPVPPSTCMPTTDKFNLTVSDDHTVYHKFYDPNTKMLMLAIGGLETAAPEGKITLKYNGAETSADYKLGDAADCKEESGSGMGFLAFILGMLLICLPLAAFLGYKKYQSVKEDGSTWDSSGKASAAGLADDYQNMGEGGM